VTCQPDEDHGESSIVAHHQRLLCPIVSTRLQLLDSPAWCERDRPAIPSVCWTRPASLAASPGNLSARNEGALEGHVPTAGLTPKTIFAPAARDWSQSRLIGIFDPAARAKVVDPDLGPISAEAFRHAA